MNNLRRLFCLLLLLGLFFSLCFGVSALIFTFYHNPVISTFLGTLIGLFLTNYLAEMVDKDYDKYL